MKKSIGSLVLACILSSATLDQTLLLAEVAVKASTSVLAFRIFMLFLCASSSIGFLILSCYFAVKAFNKKEAEAKEKCSASKGVQCRAQ